MPPPTHDAIAFPLTAHARRRIGQRGIDLSALDAVLRHGLDYPAGSGLTKRMLLQSQLAGLGEEGLDRRLIAKAFRLEAIVGPGKELVTCCIRTVPAPARPARKRRACRNRYRRLA
jgi:hypothetical protein